MERGELPTKPSDITDDAFQRRVDAIAHSLRMALGVAVLVLAWTTDFAADKAVPLTVVLIVFFFPLSPYDYLLTPRYGGTKWFDGSIVMGHTASIFVLAWIAPSIRVVALIGYIVMVVVFTMNGGRLMGFLVTAVAVPLAVLAEVLAPADERLAALNLVIFAASCLVLTILIHEMTAERAAKARDLEAALATERALRHQLEIDTAAKDRFVESVTHELRTPLAIIVSAFELLRRPDLADEQRELLFDKAALRARRLDRVVTQISDYAMLESDIDAVPAETIALDLAVDRACADLAPEIGSRTVHLDGLGGRRVHAPTTAVDRIIHSILDNAAKFSGADSTIWVSADTAPDGVQLHIRDEGRGIEADDQERVFHAFHQSGSMLPGTMGMGVGLTLVRQFVDRCNGTVRLESEPGRGTTVTVTFPTAED